MVFAMYLTIWVALALFAAGEIGRAWMGWARAAQTWPWWSWSAGIVLCAAHFALAFEVRHDWSHYAAIRATALQTRAVYGLDWGGGLWVNYGFLFVWAGDAWRWRAARRPYSPLVVGALRGFYFIVIFNAAVVFAAGGRQVIGALVALVLSAAWWTQSRSP